ncbi:MAG: hypothetical protein ACF8PN_05235 [Phycisphaerales bacterium]
MSSDTSSSSSSFTFLLDGLGDPAVAGAITAAVSAKAGGLRARSDPAALTLEVESPDRFTEDLADEVIHEARAFGLEPRDRVGSSFVATLAPDQLRDRVRHEWASRFATGLVFLLPALGLHYLTPFLAMGTTAIPRTIEAALVGWTIIAACWPVIYQALLATAALRMTPDLFAGALIVGSFIAGLVMLALGTTTPPIFHATAYAILAASFARFVVWRTIDRRAGHAHRMTPSAVPLALLFVIGVAGLIVDPLGGVAALLAIPTLIASLSINRLSGLAGPYAILPLFGFVAALLILPRFANLPTEGRIEAAFALNLGYTLLLGLFPPGPREPGKTVAPPMIDATTDDLDDDDDSGRNDDPDSASSGAARA